MTRIAAATIPPQCFSAVTGFNDLERHHYSRPNNHGMLDFAPVKS